MKFLSPFERMVAWRYLKSRRREGFVSVIAWFSLIGIALGVATLIVVMAVMNGFRADLLGRIIGIKGHIALYAHERSLGDFDNVAAQIRKVPGVLNVIPLVEGQVMATASGVSQGVAVAGFRYSDLMHKTLIVDNIKLGDMKAFERAEGVIIGDRLAQKMNLGIGDSISLMSLEGRSTAIGMMPRIKAYRLVAMFHVSMLE